MSMERLLGDRSKTRNFLNSAYFCEKTWKLNGNQTQHLLWITRKSPISQQASVFGHVLRETVAYLSKYCTPLKCVTLFY